MKTVAQSGVIIIGLFFLTNFISLLILIMEFSKYIITLAITLLFIRVLMLTFDVFNFIFTEGLENYTLKTSKNFDRYINNIDPALYKVKIGIEGQTKNDFKKSYLSHMKNIPLNKKDIISLYTKDMNAKFLNSGLEKISETKTNYIMSTNNLEMKMPFTLDNYIIFNKMFLDKLENYTESKILETFIHEKLHTIQRKNQKVFNDFYKTFYTFLHKSIELEKLPKDIKKLHMTNPDNNFDLWLYSINNKVYLPVLEIKDNGLHEFAYNYNNYNEKQSLNEILKYSKTSQTHPNELFAYEVASQIINNKLDTKIKDFLNSL